MDFSVVVPVYGCPETLNELCERLKKIFIKIKKTYEIILINDCCPKNSIEIIKEICKKNKNVIGIDFPKNQGQQLAILAGLDYSLGENVVVMDCDLQDRPEDIELMYKKINEGFDAVFARNSFKKKQLTSRMFYSFYSKMTGQKVDGRLSNFSIIKRYVVNSICANREKNRFYSLLIHSMGFNVGYVDVVRDERKTGKSGYSFKKRLKLAIKTINSQTDILIGLISFAGTILSILSLCFEMFFCVKILIIGSTKQFIIPSFFCLIFFLLGITMLVISVINKKTHKKQRSLKNTNPYVIREIINKKYK